MRRAILPALVFLLAALAPATAAEVTAQTVQFGGHARDYFFYIPDSARSPAPLLVLLHGSYQPAQDMIRLWRDKADREGIVLAAPQASQIEGWRLKYDGPHFIAAVVDDMKLRAPLDARRSYLFGQSGGAVYALTLAMLESRYFAGMSIHAGAWRHAEEFKAMELARRAIPMQIVIGDRDEFFSLAAARNTGRALTARGIPFSLEVVPGQHHWFNEKTAAGIDDISWAFLKDRVLESDPVFQDYSF